MPKQLILFRHGKSDWEADFSRDHDRPVSERGVKAAQAMGKWLAQVNKVPDLAITSSAVRARTTLDLATQAGHWPCPTQVTDDLYEASLDQVLAVIHQQPENYHSLMLVGHEPTWSEMVSFLLGGAMVQMPTAAMACLKFELNSWGQVDYGQGTLLWLLPPRLMPPGA